MPYPIVPGVGKLTFRWWDGVGHFGSRLFVTLGVPPFSQLALDNCAADAMAAWHSNMAVQTSSAYTLDQVTLLDLTTATGLEGVASGAIGGNDSGAPVDSGTTVDIQAKIDKRYRGGHPVFHHPGPGSTWLNGTRAYGAVYVSATHTKWLSFIAALNAISHEDIPSLVATVLTGYKNNALESDVHAWEIKGWTVRTGLGSMRKRLTSGP